MVMAKYAHILFTPTFSFMKPFTKQLNLQTHQPVNIQLWNGSFELRTHPELSVKILYEGINNDALIPKITQQASGIQVRNQALSSLFIQSEAVKIVIYVPDETAINIQQVAGRLTISGSYKSLKARVWSGHIDCNLDALFIKEESQLRLLSGNIFIYNDDSSIIKSRAGHDSFQQYRFYNKALFKAITHLGIVSRQSGLQSSGICVG